MALAVKGAVEPAAAGSNAAAVKVERKRIRELEKELHRKEKALAEAAALLILRKKAAAIWGEKEEDCPTTRSPYAIERTMRGGKGRSPTWRGHARTG
ncbi:MAG: hypothetical protein IPJ73_21395 [Zoogloea sp.]|nr:hypothetical protein [Zoogloea sp.]